MIRSSSRHVLLICCIFASVAFAQDSNWVAPSDSNQVAPGEQAPSLAETARKLRKTPPSSGKINPVDAKELLNSVDELSDFAAKDTGFPMRSPIKRRIVSPPELENYLRQQIIKSDASKRLSQAEISMKKFGLLPRDFDLRGFLVKISSEQIAGYYDEDTKSICLLNWVAVEQQKPIIAHELTHALQDQNYNLKTWRKAKPAASEGEESQGARHAAIEGQAMVVYIDYVLAPTGHNLKDSPGLIDQVEEPAVKALADSEMMHNTPLVLRESTVFPYREGLIFEGELLNQGGQKMAFDGVFARPPRNSHEVLQPKAYMEQETLTPVTIPDMRALLAGKYEKYDSGDMGEFDVRVLLKQYGEAKPAQELAAKWQGGSYVTYRKVGDNLAASSVSPADVALLYVSRWKTPQAAEHFARIYSAAIAKRYHTATLQKEHVCGDDQCPISSSTTLTEEGPVIVELWPDNTVIICESFDMETAIKLRDALRDKAEAVKSSTSSWPKTKSQELSMRLYELLAFRSFQLRVGSLLVDQINNALNRR